MSKLKRRRAATDTEAQSVVEVQKAAEVRSDAQVAKREKGEALRRQVFGLRNVLKAEAESAALPDDPFKSLTASGQAVEPPLDLMVLSMMEENNSELRQCVDAMVTNIEGFGGRLVLPENMKAEDKEKNKAAIEKERKQIRAFLLNFDPDDDLTSLRMKSRRDLELTGNHYWELLPAKGDPKKIVGMKLIESHTVRITKSDDVATKFEKIEIDPETGEEYKQTFYKRFRRFVQIRNNKKVYFKEWGDPRIIDRRTGEAFKDEVAAKEKKVGPENYAHILYQNRIWSPRTPYGLPRYVGNLFSIFGSRAAEEINYNTFLNNNVPAMAIMVSGNAMLTEGTIKRIEEFTQNVLKRSNNYSKFLLLEAEPAQDGLQNSGTAKIEIEKLKSEQTDDQLFQKYDANNQDKIRRAFRLPPIYVGKSADYNRGTAETSQKLAEEQIFAPERNAMDRHINKLLIWMGFSFWRFKSYAPNLTNNDDLIKMMNNIEKTGAMTPNLGRRIVGDILGQELPLYDKDQVDFDPDVPFSLTMADRVKTLGGNPSTGALAPNQGQIPNPKVPANTDLENEDADDELEKRLALWPVDENGDLDVTKMVDVFELLNKALDKSAKRGS